MTNASTRAKRSVSVLVFVVGACLALATQDVRGQLVDIATDTSDPSDLADTEPSIAVNPANPQEIVVATFSEGWGAAGVNAPLWRSVDGGTTWAKEFILPQPAAGSTGPCDQKLAFDANGQLLVAELACGVAVPRCLLYRQNAGPGTALTPGAFFCDDQPQLDIDRAPASAFLGRAYSAWLDFAPARQLSTATRSANAGANVADSAAGDNSAFSNRTTRTAVDRDGRAYAIFKTREGAAAAGFENAHFRVVRSDDGGVNWNALGAGGVSVHGAMAVETWFTTSWGNSAKGKVARARSSDAWLAADPGDGDVVAAFVDRDASNFGQIYVARSSDQGQTWATSRVTDGTHHSAYPAIAVTTNGTIGVMFIDFDDAGAATLFRHRFARSFNDGATWSVETLQSMDPGPLANAASGFLWGDYEGLAAQGFSFHGVFTGEAIGRTTGQLDPIYFERSGLRFQVCRAIPDLCGPPLRIAKELLVLKCWARGCRIIDFVPKNCLVKFPCPGCPPGARCPPDFRFRFEGLDDVWTVSLVDPEGKAVRARQIRKHGGLELAFRPSRKFFPKQTIGDYALVFSMTARGRVGVEYPIKVRLVDGPR